MGKFQIFQDGRAAGSAPVSGSDFVTKDYISSNSIWIPGSGSSSAVLRHGRGGQTALATGEGAVAHGGIWGGYGSSDATLASGESSHAEGIRTHAEGRFSHVEGSGSVAQGYGSHAEGNYVKSVGPMSHAEGGYTSASGYVSHAEGSSSEARGIGSHAEGSSSKAVGTGSHAEGKSTTASGSFSHAEGNWTLAQGFGSHAEGSYTTSSNYYEHAQGKYNRSTAFQIFSIGVGDSVSGRKNAISVITGSGATPSASIYVYGVGSYDGTNPQSEINDIATVISKLTGSIASASYNSTDKKIYFYNTKGTASCNIDATDFIKDGMVDSVAVSQSYLVLTFNTDAGKEPVSMSLTQIFNPDNFYTKSDVDTLLTTMSVGDVNVIEAVEFNGTASSISNKTASIVFETGSFENVKIFTATLSSSWNGNSWDYTVVLDNNVTGQDLIDATQNGIVYVDVDHNHGIRYHRFLVQGEVLESEDLKIPFALLYAVYPFDYSNQYNRDIPDLEVVNIPLDGSEGLAKYWRILTPESVTTGSLEGFYQDEPVVPSAYLVSASIAAVATENIWIRGTGSGSAVLSGSIQAIASGQRSVVVGSHNTVTADETLAVGQYNTGSGTYSLLVGYKNTVSGQRSFALGTQVTASGENSFAQGDRVSALGNNSYAQGGNNKALASYDHAEGYSTMASGNYSHAEGYFTTTSGSGAHAEGWYTLAQNWGAHAEGQQTTASGQYSHAEGRDTIASLHAAHAEGQGSQASGYDSHAEGYYAKAVGSSAHAEGANTFASGNYSHAEGSGSRTEGLGSHAEGFFATASGRYSHAEGYRTIASGAWSHTEGSNSLALGEVSHAEGVGTSARATGSHAEGYYTTASQRGSHAEGSSTKAFGSYAHAEGWETEASGAYSHAEGYRTRALGDYEHAQGMYNATASSQIFSIGAGSSTKRKNAISIITGSGATPSASVYVYGVGTYDGTNPQPGVNDLATVLSASAGGDEIWVRGAGSSSARLGTAGNISAGIVQANGINSVAIAGGRATGDYSFAHGGAMSENSYGVTVASGLSSHAEGFQTEASGNYSHAEGFEAKAFGQRSHAEGFRSLTTNDGAHAEGYQTTASGDYSHAEGTGTEASGYAAHAEGTNTFASQSAHAEGYGTIASGTYSHAEGYLAYATDWYSHAEGRETSASCAASHAEGWGTKAIGTSSHAEGSQSVASGKGSHASGYDVFATNDWEQALGHNNATASNQIFSVGIGVPYVSTYARRIGKNAITVIEDNPGRSGSALIYLYGVGGYTGTNPISGSNDIATVIRNLAGNEDKIWIRGTGSGSAILSGSVGATASGEGAIAFGKSFRYDGDDYNLVASGQYSFAAGSGSRATGDCSHAEGRLSQATGPYSHAEGSWATKATGTGSHAEGYGTNATGMYSHAEGNGSTAQGTASHAEGTYTRAEGNYSHAEGGNTRAEGNFSHADGYYTHTSNNAEHACGTYNFTSSGQIFSIGVGSSGAGMQKNAVSVFSGSSAAKVYIYGIGGYQGQTTSSAQDLATVINNLTGSGGGGITSESDPIYRADSASLKSAATWVGGNSASLIASGTLAKNVTAITASLVASASVAKTASSSAAALSAKSASWDALVGLPAVTAADNGKILRVVNGAWALVDPVTVYSGQGAPDSALGQDGDIYLQS